MDKKICARCLTVGKPAMITAAWVNNGLIMAERKNCPPGDGAAARERGESGERFYRAGG